MYREAGSIAPDDISADRTQVLFTRVHLQSRIEAVHARPRVRQGDRRSRRRPARSLYQKRASVARRPQRLSRSPTKDSDFGRLVQIDIASGKDTVLTTDLKWDVDTFAMSDDDRLLAYVVNEDGFSNVVVRDMVTRRALPQPQLPRGVLQNIEFSPDNSKLAFDLSTATSRGRRVDLGSHRRQPRALDQFGAWPESIPRPSRSPELVRFKCSTASRSLLSSIGRKVPPRAQHSGRHRHSRRPRIADAATVELGAQYFANVLGATVILPNVRGSDGYGKRYLTRQCGKREDSVKDIGALLDWIGTQPDLDKDRVAVYGQSYGGYMSLAVMTHFADRLVGGVERYGISDFTSFLKNTEAIAATRRAEYGDERDEDAGRVQTHQSAGQRREDQQAHAGHAGRQ